MTSSRRAVVVGAGIGGLATAVALGRAGLEVRVLERAPELAEVGAGLSLWPNALRALDALGLGDAVRAAGVAQATGGLRRPDGHSPPPPAASSRTSSSARTASGVQCAG